MKGTEMTSTLETQTGSRPRRIARRLMAVVAAVVAALVVWAVARLGLGLDVREPQWSGTARDVAAVNIVVLSAVASAAGWALLAVLERFSARAGRWWARIAAVVAVASLVGPLTVPGITASSRVVLGLLHLVVGAVLIPLLYRSSPSRKEQVR